MYLIVTLNVLSGDQVYSLFVQKPSVSEEFTYSLYFMWLKTTQAERNRMQQLNAIEPTSYVVYFCITQRPAADGIP